MAKIIRLSKALKELNISIDRAVDFLETKGKTVEKNPNSKIDIATYDILISGFKSDAKEKQASGEIVKKKINKIKADKLNVNYKNEYSSINIKDSSELNFQVDSGKLENKKIISNNIKIKKPNIIGKIDINKYSKNNSIIQSSDNVNINKDVLVNNENENKQEKITNKIETIYTKLDGPNFTGDIIDLSRFEKKSSDDNKNSNNKRSDNNINKKKRKRINKVSKTDTINIIKNNKFKNKIKDNINNNTSKLVELSEEDVKKQIRETLDKLTNKNKLSKSSKHRREKRKERRVVKQLERESNKNNNILKVTEYVTVNELASLMDVSVTEVISACIGLGVMVTMNQRLELETIELVANDFGYNVEFVTVDISVEDIEEQEDEINEIRPPIVTVMGHVDHGKTSLLDYIKKSNVISGESGGITQHIGAYSVSVENGKKITFLDTPGHEAFTAMRARGTQITDIAVIVIAADDSIMPQTKEAISHAQAAGVPMIFAINKIDKEGANPDKVKEQLASINLLVEDWGGNYQSHNISAKTGKGVNELLEKILLQSEIMDLKANPNKLASGVVIEATLDKGRGYISTILVQNGTLKLGDYLLAGSNHGKVRAMIDEKGNKLKISGPSTPVIVLGLNGAPSAGDKFRVYTDEREAKNVALKRSQLFREQTIRTQKHITLDEIGRRIAIGNFKELNIVLKGDVDGSVEALTDSFQKLSNDQIIVKIIYKGVGQITESDILLASASDAVVIGFNIRPSISIREIADKEKVEIRTYSIIYDAIKDIKEAMEGMLSPDIKENILGTIEVRNIFKVSKVGLVAGCMVLEGKIKKNSNIRVIRDGVIIHDGVLSSLKRFKEDVKEVMKGYECGLSIKNFNNLFIGDNLEIYEKVEVKKKLN